MKRHQLLPSTTSSLLNQTIRQRKFRQYSICQNVVGYIIYRRHQRINKKLCIKYEFLHQTNRCAFQTAPHEHGMKISIAKKKPRKRREKTKVTENI
jgi:hypothetical protein